MSKKSKIFLFLTFVFLVLLCVLIVYPDFLNDDNNYDDGKNTTLEKYPLDDKYTVLVKQEVGDGKYLVQLPYPYFNKDGFWDEYLVEINNSLSDGVRIDDQNSYTLLFNSNTDKYTRLSDDDCFVMLVSGNQKLLYLKDSKLYYSDFPQKTKETYIDLSKYGFENISNIIFFNNTSILIETYNGGNVVDTVAFFDLDKYTKGEKSINMIYSTREILFSIELAESIDSTYIGEKKLTSDDLEIVGNQFLSINPVSEESFLVQSIFLTNKVWFWVPSENVLKIVKNGNQYSFYEEPYGIKCRVEDAYCIIFNPNNLELEKVVINSEKNNFTLEEVNYNSSILSVENIQKSISLVSLNVADDIIFYSENDKIFYIWNMGEKVQLYKIEK